MNFLKLYIFTLLLCGISQTFAQLPDMGKALDRKERQEQARQWKINFENLNDQIPNLSPENLKWVVTEQEEAVKFANKSGGGVRLITLKQSKEYNIFIVKSETKQILEILNLLLDEKLSEKQEMLLWIKLCTYFADIEYWQSVECLIEFKIIKGDPKGISFPSGIGTNFPNSVLNSHTILTTIIRPYIISHDTAQP